LYYINNVGLRMERERF